MGKVRKTRKNTFKYSVNRKKLKRRARKKDAPRIACDEIRKAWDDNRSVASNLAEMGLAFDPNKALPIRADAGTSTEQKIVRKPYVIQELKASASLPSKKTMTISSDMVHYVRHMVENYGEDYKAMARDEQNYYQDTPKQIQRKVNLYRQHHPAEYQALLTSRAKQ
ncbi:nucleolar protein 16 [Bufo gargarizans]|uniref:nucleolar protein 16 n=1 Tax=Bufo bufo TaxID=8384 RepID=UPI001ABE27B8|nr:nucleolar protein 16 [Bufo bufo]XP_044136744.1 nucleolar protein 16 [Bufo gargarizans]